jgi:hypothetical protein
MFLAIALKRRLTSYQVSELTWKNGKLLSEFAVDGDLGFEVDLISDHVEVDVVRH